MKHSMIKKMCVPAVFLLFLFCCTHEDESLLKDSNHWEVQNFFDITSIQSRSDGFTDLLVQVVTKTLLSQDNLLRSVMDYQEKYGIPLWLHGVGISTSNGFQLFVPVLRKGVKNEIDCIWHFGIYNNRLYHFTLMRNTDNKIVEEYWKYDYFTINALGKKPSSGLYFENASLSRSAYDCQLAYVGMEIDGEEVYELVDILCWEVDDSQYLTDDGSGGGGGAGSGGFPSDIPIDNGSELPSGGMSGSGNGNAQHMDSKAKVIFRNSNMSEENWRVIENMLEKIMENCMGQNLYEGLVSKLGGKTLTIQFVEGNSSSFNFTTGDIKISIGNMESNHLFHEMFHAYQAYKETIETFRNSVINQEIEAHYAQYLYLKKLPEYPGSKWAAVWGKEGRHNLTSLLEIYLTDKGQLVDGENEVGLKGHIKNLVNAFLADPNYNNFNYDSSRQGLSNFQVLQSITKGC